MPAARYVFVSDQGHVFSSADEPTAEDLEYAAVGMRMILSLIDGRYYGREKRWLPIPAGRLTSVVIDGKRSLPVHSPISE